MKEDAQDRQIGGYSVDTSLRTDLHVHNEVHVKGTFRPISDLRS